MSDKLSDVKGACCMNATVKLRTLNVQTEKPKAQYAQYTSQQNVLWLLGSAKSALKKAGMPKEVIDEMMNKCLNSAWPESERVLSDYVSWSYSGKEGYTPSFDEDGNEQKATLVIGGYYIGDTAMLCDEWREKVEEESDGFSKLSFSLIDNNIIITLPIDGEMQTDQGDEFDFHRAVVITSWCEPKHINMEHVQAQFHVYRKLDIFVSDEENGRFMVIGELEFDSDFMNRCAYCGEKYCEESCMDSDEDENDAYYGEEE